jgi:hypothetical protein
MRPPHDAPPDPDPLELAAPRLSHPPRPIRPDDVVRPPI